MQNQKSQFAPAAKWAKIDKIQLCWLQKSAKLDFTGAKYRVLIVT
jgi:hypothetical protein